MVKYLLQTVLATNYYHHRPLFNFRNFKLELSPNPQPLEIKIAQMKIATAAKKPVFTKAHHRPVLRFTSSEAIIISGKKQAAIIRPTAFLIRPTSTTAIGK